MRPGRHPTPTVRQCLWYRQLGVGAETWVHWRLRQMVWPRATRVSSIGAESGGVDLRRAPMGIGTSFVGVLGAAHDSACVELRPTLVVAPRRAPAGGRP